MNQELEEKNQQLEEKKALATRLQAKIQAAKDLIAERPELERRLQDASLSDAIEDSEEAQNAVKEAAARLGEAAAAAVNLDTLERAYSDLCADVAKLHQEAQLAEGKELLAKLEGSVEGGGIAAAAEQIAVILTLRGMLTNPTWTCPQALPPADFLLRQLLGGAGTDRRPEFFNRALALKAELLADAQ